jgi:hypothetical protein
VAVAGDAAPGGGTFSDFMVHYAINALGQLAFVANLDGTSNVGLYGGLPNNLVKIVRRGMLSTSIRG